MSQLFDALQRSEAERSGADLSALSGATELLQLAELHADSDRENAFPFAHLGGENAEGEMVFERNPVPAPAETIVEIHAEASPSLDDKHSNLFSQVQSLQISVPSENRLVCLTDSESLAAEKYRFLGVYLQHLRRDRPLKRVLITSSIPKEGKSTVSANLACTLARRTQQKTLLVEGDLRRGALSPMFGLAGIPGICDLPRGEPNLSAIVYHLDGPNLWFLPAGNAAKNPLEILQSGRLSAAMDQLSAVFDWIIIDSPPVMPLADTSVWMRLADGILLVTRQGITEKQQLQRGLEAIEPKKLIGAVLNGSRRITHSDYYYPTVQA